MAQAKMNTPEQLSDCNSADEHHADNPGASRGGTGGGGDGGSGKATSSSSSSKASSRKSQAADGGLSRRSRPRASLACMHCRQRKVKCHMDGGRLPCTSCSALRIECVISRDGDRRKAGSREQVTALQDRVNFLESLVSRNRDHDPPHHHDVPTAPSSSTAAVRHIKRPQPIPRNSSSDTNSVGAAAYQQSAAGNMETSISSINLPEHSSRWPQHRASATQLHPQAASVTPSVPGAFDPPESRSTPPADREATTRLDIDTDSLSLRFYGPSSQLHVQSRVPADNDGERSFPGHTSLEVDMDSPPVRQSLLQIFWKTQYLIQPLVIQPWFEGGRVNSRRSEYFSNFLEHAMLACASRMSTSADIRALGSKFAERAATDIAQELQWPNIATLQGYLLLSDFESTRGRNRLGYMYCGMGSRLIFDLGIGENCLKLIAEGKVKHEEAIFRHNLLLSALVYDRLWGYYLGRPCAIPDSHILAAERAMMQIHDWKPSPRADTWTGLCRELTEATDLLNCTTLPDVERMALLIDLDNRISHRWQTLHPSLALDEDRPSQLGMDAYGLHVQILGLRIVLHRDLSKATSHNSRAATGATSLVDNNSSLGRSRAVMYESSIRIARLLSMYQQLFGIENIITIMLDGLFIASQAFASHILTKQSENPDQDIHWLKLVADTLAQAQKHYPVAARMRSTLSRSVEKTHLAGTFGQWAHNSVTPPSGQTQPDPQIPVGMQSVEIFGQESQPGFVHDHPGQDITLLDGSFGDFGDMGMDYRNSMSWVLGPPG